MKKIDIMDKKIIFLGVGGIGKCISYYLSKFYKYNINNLYLIDKDNEQSKFPTIKKLCDKGANFINYEITNSNYKSFFSKMIDNNNIIIFDCTTRTPCITWIKFLSKYDIYYINTSIECSLDEHIPNNIYKNSISYQHKQLEKIKYNGKFLIEYGMNPGIITSLCYKALDDISKYLNIPIINNNYSNFAEKINIQTIHCSEIDTQFAKKIDKTKFNNTWSVVALLDELNSDSELYVGNNSNKSELLNKFKFKKNKLFIKKYIDNNDILFINDTANNNLDYSICYTGNIDDNILKLKNAIKMNNDFSFISGYLIHHGEILDIGTMLKTKNFSPSVAYVYNINPEAEKGLENNKLQDLVDKSIDAENNNVMNVYNNKLNGVDNIGIYIKSDKIEWWCGTVLSTDYTKNILKDLYFGPTVIQVMTGVLGGLSWLLTQQKGKYYGRDVNHKFIFKKMNKYLNIISKKI